MDSGGMQGRPRRFFGIARRIMTIVLGVLLAAVLVAVGVVALRSPGTPRPYVGEDGNTLPNSISEKVFVEINGVEQGMVITGRDLDNPVLLYLHGGMPDYFLTGDYPTGMDEYFTVVWWDQRGQCLSFDPDMPKESLTPEQIVDDTIAVANYLRERFGQDKIYLMGHSGGTFFGMQAAAREPELFHAYIAVAQMTNQLKSEQAAHAYMLEAFTEAGDDGMVRKLEAGPVTDEAPLPREYTSVRDVGMHKLGIGTTRDMRSIVTGLLLRSMWFRDYTLAEKIDLWRGKIYSGQALWNEQLTTDITELVPRVEIPVYFLHGVHDYTVSYPQAREYFDALEAPVKGFYTYDDSAHSPFFEEPDKTRKIMLADVLEGRVTLADQP